MAAPRADAAHPPAADRPLAGAGWMLASGLLFVAVNGLVKYLGSSLPSAEAAFLRYALGLIFFLPALRPLARASYGTRFLGLVAARGLVHSIGVMLWFYAMARISMAEVTALNYLAPVLVTLGAALFLGERLALRRICAIFVAMIGVVVVLRPGLRTIEPGHVAMLVVAVTFACSYLIAKKLTATHSPTVVVALLSITVTIGLLPFALADWVTPGWHEIGVLFLTAGFATGGHLAMTQAFRLAPVTVTQPVTFLQLLWATLLGTALFGEPVDAFVMLGGGIIIAAIAFITWREAVLNRRITPPMNATKV